MDAHRFDALSKTLATGLARRGFMRRAGAATLVVLGLRSAAKPAAARVTKGTASTGACSCTGCGNASCNCIWDPWTGEPSCASNCITCNPFSGVAGGGQVQLESGEATLSLVATAVHDEANEPTGQGIGLLRWVDADGGVTLESLGIGAYGPVGDLEGVRRVDGLVMANGAGPYPFELIVTDVGTDGKGLDTISLAVGDAVAGESGHGFAYTAEGNLISGDLVGTWTLPVLPKETPPATPTS